MKKNLLILLFFVFTTVSVAQTTVTWDGGGDGVSWHDANNWDTNTVPTVNDDVVINNTLVSGNIYAEISAAAASAKSILLESTAGSGRIGSTEVFLDIKAGTSLTVPGNITINNPGTLAEIGLWDGSTLYLGGSISGTGTFNPDYQGAGNTVVYNGAATQDIYLSSNYENLTLDNTGTATLAGNITLTGNFTNNGNFSHTSGTITFAGAGGTISGSAITQFLNVAFNGNTSNNGSVEIKSAGTVSIGSSVTLDADGSSGTGNFRLLSTSATNTAKILSIPSGSSVTGNLIIERFMQDIDASHGTEDWRYISSPITSASVADLQSAKTQEFFITGTFTGASTCGTCSTNPSMHYYDETTLGVLSDGWVDFPTSSNTETLDVGRGYIVWQRDENSPVTLELNGQVNQGNISLPVTFTNGGTGDPLLHDGWNLVGNPYPAPVDWSNQAAWSFTDLNGTVYVRDNDGFYGTKGDFVEHNGSVGSPSAYEGRIAQGQAFWVKSDGGTPSLTVTENAKTSTSTNFLRKAAPDNVFRIKMAKNTEVWDEAVIHFRDDAVVEYESDIDALKRESYNVNFSTMSSDNIPLVINSLPTANCSEIPVYIHSKNAKGTYELSFSGEETFTYGFKATLIDSYLDKSVEVTENTSYSFDVTDNEATYGAERFTLIVSKEINTGVDMNLSSGAVCAGENSTITLSNPQEGINYKAVVNGEVVSEAISDGKALDLTIPTENSTSTAGIVITASTECYGEVEIPQAIELIIKETPVPEITRVDEFTLQSNYTTGNQWYFNNEEIPGATGQELEIESTGTYSLKVVNENNCEARVDANLTVTSVDEKIAELGVEVYPNPVGDVITINTGSMKDPQMQITTVSGSVKYTQPLKAGLNTLELSKLEKGLYLIKIRDRNDQVVLRIIKK